MTSKVIIITHLREKLQLLTSGHNIVRVTATNCKITCNFTDKNKRVQRYEHEKMFRFGQFYISKISTTKFMPFKGEVSCVSHVSLLIVVVMFIIGFYICYDEDCCLFCHLFCYCYHHNKYHQQKYFYCALVIMMWMAGHAILIMIAVIVSSRVSIITIV